MVIGGVHDDKGSVGYASSLYKLSQASLEIGRSLALKGHKLIVCSPFQDSADFHVLKGAASVVNPVMAHIFFPAEQNVTSEISGLKASIGDVELEPLPSRDHMTQVAANPGSIVGCSRNFQRWSRLML